MSVSTTSFWGDSVVEAANSGMEYGFVRVATNMNFNLSGSTQIKISENQSHRKNM